MPERNLDFDKIINRYKTRCLKYDFKTRRGLPEDVLPLWVADMDFKTSSYIEDAVKSVAEHNIYGYINTQPGDGFFDAVALWMKRHHDWDVEEKWHVKTPGVVFAISAAVRALTKPGDAVLIQQPVYYPFANVVRSNDRKLIVSDLVKREDGKFETDYEDFEKKITENDVKLFILCNPHNPVGRAWKKEELLKIGRICRDHKVFVFSDEIHFDFIWNGKHNVFQEQDESFKEFTITATSASKTFNLAGLQQSNIFIPDPAIKRRFISQIDATGYDEPNICGIAATEAAYLHGEEWYLKMRSYVEEGIDRAVSYVNENIPGVKLVKPEGTYLIWLDFTGAGLYGNKLDDLIINKAGLWLDSGKMFGGSGDGYQRLNAACPHSILEEALERIKNAMEKL